MKLIRDVTGVLYMCTKEGEEGILTSPVSACATGPSDSQGLGAQNMHKTNIHNLSTSI